MTQKILENFKQPKKAEKTRALPPPPPDAICSELGLKHVTIDYLAGDGSDRCYYRVSSPERDRTLVLMQLSKSDQEALRENGYRWIHVAKDLFAHGIKVPRVEAILPDWAALVIEDYGDLMLETKIKSLVAEGNLDDVFMYYKKTFQMIEKFLRMPSGAWSDTAFDEAALTWELGFFERHALTGVLSPQQRKAFETDCKTLARSLALGSKYFVHRDFHSRNIMVWNRDLALIDFQDARLGHPCYDLVSVCFDAYVPLTTEIRMKLVEIGLSHINNSVAEQDLDWQAVLLQRQLKAIGSFFYLTNEKGRGDYLGYVPKALESLKPSLVFDERWPFISSELIDILRENING